MDKSQILDHLKKLLKRGEQYEGSAYLSAAKELIKLAVGTSNTYFEGLIQLEQRGLADDYLAEYVDSMLRAFKDSVELDLIFKMSIERKAQLNVVNDYLEQADHLLNTKDIHPAAAAIVIGASLEEFLRNWCEELGKEVTKNDGIDAYSKFLRDKDVLGKQDSKDILSWAGIRNDAAHGHWSSVDDRKRIQLMLESVNHFIRTKSPNALTK